MWIRWWSNKPAPLSAVMKRVFLNVFMKIVSIQVGRHNAGDNALCSHLSPMHHGASHFNIRSVMSDCVGHIVRNVITYLSAE